MVIQLLKKSRIFQNTELDDLSDISPCDKQAFDRSKQRPALRMVLILVNDKGATDGFRNL